MEEYIMEQLKQLEEAREDLNSKIVTLTKKEEELKQKLQQLALDHDTDLEIFSPRYPDEEIRRESNDIQMQLDEIQLQQVKIQSEIETCTDKIEKFHEILLTARIEENKMSGFTEKVNSRTEKVDQEEDNNDEKQGESKEAIKDTSFDLNMRDKMETVLHRVEKCLNLIHTDKLKCKNELKQLRYYLRAVISEYDNSEK